MNPAPKKSPDVERKLILARDERRKYGSQLTFQIQKPEDIGGLEDVTLLLDDGTLATISPARSTSWESGKRYHIKIEGFPTASEAELAGLQIAQSLLLSATSLNFGLRLNYRSHQPPTVYDRTVSPGATAWGEASSHWPQEVVLADLERSLAVPFQNHRLLLSMELFVASSLESNDRARFVMAVSALEPLAEQQELGPEVSEVMEELRVRLDADRRIPSHLRDSLRGRLLQLKRESVRQALRRLCAAWFPNDTQAWVKLDRAYGLRSELLHEGRPADLDVLLHEEISVVSSVLRAIYQQAYAFKLRAPVA